MAKILSALFGGLQNNGKICQKGKIRSDLAAEALGGIGAFQYCGRLRSQTTADYIRSLYIAYGSNCELETQIILSADLSYIENGISEKIKDEIQRIERMLKALIKTLENKHLNP